MQQVKHTLNRLLIITTDWAYGRIQWMHCPGAADFRLADKKMKRKYLGSICRSHRFSFFFFSNDDFMMDDVVQKPFAQQKLRFFFAQRKKKIDMMIKKLVYTFL